MFEVINNTMASAMDYVLGWTLHLPSDAALFAVAILTSAILTFARLLSTDQNWLKRAAADHRRLKQLAREAKARGDREAVARCKSTMTLVKVRSMRFEAKPLLVAIVPVALVATWAFARLGYHPPMAGETVEVRAYLSTTAIGRPAHLVPEEGLEAEGGWVQTVAQDKPAAPEGLWDAMNARMCGLLGRSEPLEGVAVWRLKARGRPEPYILKIRYGGRTYEKELLVGSTRYAPAVAFFEGGPVRCVEVVMAPVKLFGVVGGLDVLYLPPWLLAYLLIAIPFVTILKRVFRIA
jgi:uncharacterized membrane protein (DUF106 family)